MSIVSQQWSFQRQASLHMPTFSLTSFDTKNGATPCVQLTPPTVAPSVNRLSLFADSDAGAVGSSVDADILAAQRFLRQHHPEVEIPDFVLSQAIYDNAQALQDTAHELDGSLGIADAHGVAIMGPITFEQRRIYAVICIGGSNRDCILLHQLEILSCEQGPASASASPQMPTSHADANASATNPSRLRFVPAHKPERSYQTPVLQLLASPRRDCLAVRTYTGTSFLTLSHQVSPQGLSRLFLGTTYHTQYSTHGCSQHQDVCFGPGQGNVAASVDRLGNLHLYHLPTIQQIPSPAEPNPESPAPQEPHHRRQGQGSCASHSACTTPMTPPSATQSRIPAHLLAQAILDFTEAQDRSRPDLNSSSQTSADLQFSEQAPFRISFGGDDRSLFLLTRNFLVHIKLDRLVVPSNLANGAAVDFETAPQISTILQSSFCLTTFRRARFTSMAASTDHAEQPLLAVCSSDSIYWLDLESPSKPLFSTAHHRGDDPTLVLTKLPPIVTNASDSRQQGRHVGVWALSSRRNAMISCYIVRHRGRSEAGLDLLQSNSIQGISPRCNCDLDAAPVLMPTAASGRGSRRPGAAPIYFDLCELLGRGQGLDSWISFEVTDRGAVLAQLVRVSWRNALQEAPHSDHTVRLDVAQPPANTTLLYMNDSDTPKISQGRAESSSRVKTRGLSYQKLHRTLFSIDKNRTPARSLDNHSEGLFDLQSEASSDRTRAHAATLSLGQLIRDLVKGRSRYKDEHSQNCPRPSWSTALDLLAGEEPEENMEMAILNVRSDARNTLSSLGLSTAQLAWSRSATVLSNDHTEQAAHQHGHSPNPGSLYSDILENALKRSMSQNQVRPFLPAKEVVQPWRAKEQRALQDSLRTASRHMMLDLTLEAEIFARPKARILDEGASTQRPQSRQSTNWTAFEHRDIYNFVEEQGDTIPPPHIGSVGLSFFAPLRSGDAAIAVERGGQQDCGNKGLNEAQLESLLPSTSATARLLLAEWQLGDDPTEYTYLDPFEGLHRLPRASRLGGPTARARSRSFSRASSASTEDRSRSRSRTRSRQQSTVPSFSQSVAFASQDPSSSHAPSVVSHTQAFDTPSGAPPMLASRRKRHHDTVVSRSQPIRAPTRGHGQESWASSVPKEARSTNPGLHAASAPQSQPAAPKFGFAGSFGDLTPLQVGTPMQHNFAASTQIEAGRFGARPVKTDRPSKKKKRASGF